jgi:hypothetical protein
MRRQITALLLAAVFSVAAACSSNNPSSPSSLDGVSVSGSIVTPGGGGAGTNTIGAGPGTSVTIPAGLTITVVGTTNTAVVNSNGTFTINGVPAGNVDLRLNGPGWSALISLLELQTGQIVTITITLEGSAASLDSDLRRGPAGEQLEGRVESLPPTTPAGTLIVAGRKVTTSNATNFVMQGQPATFADLAIGQRVHVKGQPGVDSLLATWVNIQNTNTDVGLNFNGNVSEFTGTAAAFQFKVNGQLIKGDNLTVFFGNSSFSELANGKKVEVKGAMKDGYVYASRIHVNK